MTKDYESMTTDELEFTLPLHVCRQEKKAMPCEGCQKAVYIQATYEMELWRSDSFSSYEGRKYHNRIYEISYKNWKTPRSELCRTARHKTLREVLIAAHEMLDEMGLEDLSDYRMEAQHE
jgi:hypothetical protein